MARSNRTIWAGLAVIIVVCAVVTICCALAAVLYLDDVRRVVSDRATATPTATAWPQLLCTPPSCEADEVYHCPGDCSGGCGTECATPTATAERQPLCTPPACEDDEVYYCPDDCPGGCGTECATPTAVP